MNRLELRVPLTQLVGTEHNTRRNILKVWVEGEGYPEFVTGEEPAYVLIDSVEALLDAYRFLTGKAVKVGDRVI